MSATRIMDLFSAWLDLVAATLAGLLAQLRHRRPLRLEEGADGVFTLTLADGGRFALRLNDPHGDSQAPELPPAIAARLKNQPVELRLDSARMLFRPLELPRAAAPFLDGIVRAQIDRLTPWSAPQALYGWTPPEETTDDQRIRLEVAATPRALVAALIARLEGLGTGPVSVTASEPGTGRTIALLKETAERPASGSRLRKGLLAGLGGAALLATAALLVSDFAARGLDDERASLDARIATTRRLLMAARDGAAEGGPAVRALAQRKREVPAAVLVLDDLSRVLPDDTYVTDLELDGSQVRMAGVSAAPADLIRLLEQSGRFTRATFVGPTTPLPKGGGERFDIEARMVPLAEAPR